MILFHGSTHIVQQPDLKFCRKNTDFGKGFYTTTSKAQAIERLKTHTLVDQISFHSQKAVEALRFLESFVPLGKT